MERKLDLRTLEWVHEPKLAVLKEDRIVLETEPYTDLRPAGKSAEAKELKIVPQGNFHLTLRVDFDYHAPFDQCGLLLYDGDHKKAVFGTEKRDGETSKLYCIVFHQDGSDRSERDIGSAIRWMYYRVWFRNGHVRIQYSFNGRRFSNLREFALARDAKTRVGIYACSPGNSWFDCTFSEAVLNDEEEINKDE